MKVLLVDDDPAYESLAAWLRGRKGCEVQLVDNTAVLPPLLPQWNPDIIILDLVIRDPETGLLDHNYPAGVIAANLIHAHYPHLPLLIYTSHPTYFSQLQQISQRHTAGFGYLLKAYPNEQLWAYMLRLCEGETCIDPEAEQVRQSQRPPYPPDMQALLVQAKKAYPRLSQAEKEVVAGVAHCLTNRQIALERQREPDTVAQQLTQAAKTLGVQGKGRIFLALVYWQVQQAI
jgi:DNA-binding NarL/FixJ family response regulator